MNRFPFILARWEARHAFSRIGVFMLSISLGVAALVAVRSFRADMSRSIADEAQALLGGDIRLSARRPLEGRALALLDSLEAAGHPSARTVTTPSMVLAPSSGIVRLVQVRAVDGRWPLYGSPTTTPSGRWGDLPAGDQVVVDPPLLTQFGVTVGASLQIGRRRFRIAATVEGLPASPGVQAAVGPRVYLRDTALESTGVLVFASLARYQTFLSIPEPGDQGRIATRYEDMLDTEQVDFDTAREEARDLTEAVGFLGRYLGLVGLGALLLGGIGVGSAIHVFVKERLTEVAVLRCLGAVQRSVFGAFVLQAAALGLAGSLVGAAVGVGLQFLLPLVLSGALPVPVQPALAPGTVAGGVAVGVWVALVFSLLPLLSVRDTPPLRALRHSLEPPVSARDPWRVGAVLLIGASVGGLAVLEAPSWREGLAFAGGLAVTVGVLALLGRLLGRLARRFLPRSAPYPVRQGLSNLFRPRNQTVAVTLALGFGAFVVCTVLLIQQNLARELRLESLQGQPNLLLFDIQDDQREGVLELLPPSAREGAEVTPLVSSRVAAINGRDRDALQTLPWEEQPAGWALRRDYRHTWRDTLTDAETLVEGAWWDEAPPAEPGVARISMEVEVARDLNVELGDRVTWDVSGIPVESRVVSLREVDWGRFQTNFFVVFEPGALDGAPASWVVLTGIPDATGRAGVQQALVERFPNVSALDLTRVQEAVRAILEKVGQGIAFLAVFAALAGVLDLAGALASSRHQRLVEGALLRTVGARRGQILAILMSEYLALGALGALAGTALGATAAGLLLRFGFQVPVEISPWIPAGIWAGVCLVTVVTGLLGSRDLLRRPPLPVLRGD